MNQPAEQILNEDQEQEQEYISDEDLFAAEFDRRTEPNESEGESDQTVTDDGEGDGQPEGATSAQGQASPPLGEEETPTQQVEGQDTPTQQVDGEESTLPDGSKVKRPDWYKDLTPEAQKHFDQTAKELNHLNWQYSTVHGRLAPTQQENARLQKRLADLELQLRGTQPGTNPAPGSQSQPAATPPDLHTKEFAEFAEAFPDEARAIEAMVGAKTAQIEQLSQTVQELQSGFTQMRQQSTQQTRSAELDKLTTAHPDWASVRNSEDFNGWLQHQPNSVTAMVNSRSADDCIWALDAYKAAVYLRTLNQQPPARTDPAAEQAQAQRTARRNTPPAPAPAPSGVSAGRTSPLTGLSDEDIFAQEAERRARRNF